MEAPAAFRLLAVFQNGRQKFLAKSIPDWLERRFEYFNVAPWSVCAARPATIGFPGKIPENDARAASEEAAPRPAVETDRREVQVKHWRMTTPSIPEIFGGPCVKADGSLVWV